MDMSSSYKHSRMYIVVLLLGSPALQGEAAFGGGVGEANTLTFRSYNRRYERILPHVNIFLHKLSYARIQK